MIMKPWEMGPEAWDYIQEFPVDQQAAVTITYQHFNYNSYKVPCVAAFVMYGLFLMLILAATCNNLLAWGLPSFHLAIKQKSRLLRAHVWEHPLVTHKHATVVSLPHLRWLTLQLPLRGESFIILCLCLINIIPLVAFYNLLYGDQQVFYPGPHNKSKWDQIQRHLADRTAILGTAQLPLLIMMASKRSPLAIVSSLGVDRLMLYHRWIARWFWAHILIHTAVWTAVYAQTEGVKVMLADTYVRWGCVGFSAMCGLVFLSLRSLRQRYYELFVMTHIVLAVFAILGTYLHIKLANAAEYEIFKVMTEMSAAIWAFDRLVRFINRLYLSFTCPRLSLQSSSTALIRCTSAQLQSIGTDAEYTQLRISVPASKLRLSHQLPLLGGIAAGDDIRITIPRLQWLGEHPFTVFAVGACKQDSSQGYIDLLIKAQAGLTRRLADHTLTLNKAGEKDVELDSNNGDNKESSVAVLIEGPFGTVPEISDSTTDLVLVAGGIAITFCWPIFVKAFQARVKASKLRSCKLIWIVRAHSTLALLEEAFNELIKDVQCNERDSLASCRFSVDIYVTCSNKNKHNSSMSESGSVKEEKQLSSVPATPAELTNNIVVELAKHSTPRPQHCASSATPFQDGQNGNLIKVTHFAGRPAPLSTALFSHLDVSTPLSKLKGGLTVALCGPPSLCDEVRYNCVALMKRGVNVELVEEGFSL